MRAVLDHIGIAVEDIDKALAFYRDALGLEVEAPEEVPTRTVRRACVPVGGPALELLEATAPESADCDATSSKRGPGHPSRDAARGGPSCRAGATQGARRAARRLPSRARVPSGSLVAFIHPSAAHGVLVELKQRAGSRREARRHAPHLRRPAADRASRRPLPAGWRRDVRRRAAAAVGEAGVRPTSAIAFSSRCGRCSSRRRGAGCSSTAAPATRWPRSRRDIYALDRTCAPRPRAGRCRARRRRRSTSRWPRTCTSITSAARPTRGRDGVLVPRFPNARYLIRAAEWEDATHPHERNRASYLQDDFVPLKARPASWTSSRATVRSSPACAWCGPGGTPASIRSSTSNRAGKTAVFVADLIPTTAHLQDPWVMGYDLFPMDTLAFKRRFIREAIDREYLIFFEHDPLVAAGYIRENATGKRCVEQVL